MIESIRGLPVYLELLTGGSSSSFSFEARPKSFQDLSNEQSVDLDYAVGLLSNFENPNLKKEQRIQALVDNLCFNTNEINYGNSLQIDEAGYFLTAAHNYVDFDSLPQNLEWNTPPSYIYNPRVGSCYSPSAILYNIPADIAIVYAPTGKKRRRIDGITFKKDDLVVSDPLSILTYSTTKPQQLFDLNILSGRCIGGLSRIGRPNDIEVEIEGVDFQGGKSGSPVVDEDGFVRGVVIGTIERDIYWNNELIHSGENQSNKGVLTPTSMTHTLNLHNFL